jgi:heme exporter protein C
LHPGGQGTEGNPGLNPKDTTNAMRSVMYPAALGWTLLCVWITTLRIRVQLLQEKKLNHE